ncbi:MAG: ATP-binding cassette domain-containing protein [Candidatus Bathyarchaeota archaeon]|nr:MAG: ATP-binding cassette domain-containing protein [Candidatus Bathyarchaeota archaeon]
MKIKIRGAREHNLKSVDIDIADGLTVVTGVSGSGKTSLVFDTMYHEARRRFLEIFSTDAQSLRLSPAQVDSVIGIGPAVAVRQNTLNRNPLSTLATASGLHPFLRLLFARFGARHCPNCKAKNEALTQDEIIAKILSFTKKGPITLYAPLVRRSKGCHQTLLKLLTAEFAPENVIIDGQPWRKQQLDAYEPHSIEISIAHFDKQASTEQILKAVQTIAFLGATAVRISNGKHDTVLSRTPTCYECGTYLGDLEPVHFHTPCPFCQGKGCYRCNRSGLDPKAASVLWQNKGFNDFLALSVEEARFLFAQAELPETANRLRAEIKMRLNALKAVGLGYIHLDRSSPTLSRGESQRVRLAVSLTSCLEDILHVLDEPTIGQHPADVARILPIFRNLPGPVVYVEHDRLAASYADQAIDLGPGAGAKGGHVTFVGTPSQLWKSPTDTGRYFGRLERVKTPKRRTKPENFIKLHGAKAHNLRNIDISIPLHCLTVITGVSGSGKSTLIEDVLTPSINKQTPIGCQSIEGLGMKAVMVDQSPIGKNPRSNPATYTKLSDVIRDLFARETGLSPSHFSFNRPEGACPKCQGMGAVEVRMRYLPSTWIPCSDCEGQRFSDRVLDAKVAFGEQALSIADFYNLPIIQARNLLLAKNSLPDTQKQTAQRVFDALTTVGLGYLTLGQPSPTLSGGEAQRVKLAKYLGRRILLNRLLILDEPSTGLHPKDLSGLLKVLDRLARAGATIVVVEHNTDIIRAADWIIDLGPFAGPDGGQVVYAGPPAGLIKTRRSLTSQALKDEGISCFGGRREKPYRSSNAISVRNARANNLKGIDVDIPKSALTVVTGVSGSGKSSLLRDVLESEARRRFLETLSLYERQSTREGPEAPVNSITGLGVSVSITPGRRLYRRRSTVGAATEVSHHLAVLLSLIGERDCLKCGAKMQRSDLWLCLKCGNTAQIAKPRHFSSSTYSAACPKCHGVGSLQVPVPEKLIVNPEKPLCAGAMYSPGFFPQGYLCKPYNGGYYEVQALGVRYDFDPHKTAWKKMSLEARNAFLFGDPEQLTVTYESRKRPARTTKIVFNGFYNRWLRDWDVGGTYTEAQPCKCCDGTGFRPECLAVTLSGKNVYELSQIPLTDLVHILENVQSEEATTELAETSLKKGLRRLRFLLQVGLGYLHLNRVSGTLSAGEAQRVRLAGLLGSGLTSLTILLDEPTRGMHPSEVEALLSALVELRNEGNTVVLVEHDLMLIKAADNIIDMGPGTGVSGGEVVAVGQPSSMMRRNTVTAEWMRGERRMDLKRAGQTQISPRWLEIRGARAHNLKGETIRIPLGMLVGLCGVSGSGKSTLLIDTVGRVLAPKKITTSVAYEPMKPGKHDTIEGAPSRAILLDQARKGIWSPGQFLGLFKPLLRSYAESDDAKALGLNEKELSRPCSACDGRGSIRIRMGFLPDIYSPCDTCRGTGRSPEAWEVRVKGLAFPELNSLTIDEVHKLFGHEPAIRAKLEAAREVGLGYLVLRQPGYTLSGGEVQRLRIAKELSKKTNAETLYILDEPTVGQHLEDVNRLIKVLRKLVHKGHTVIVIEHHPHLLASCDWLIELGPEGGPNGGRIIASSPPENVANKNTPTASYIRSVMEGEL